MDLWLFMGYILEFKARISCFFFFLFVAAKVNLTKTAVCEMPMPAAEVMLKESAFTRSILAPPTSKSTCPFD